MVHPRPLSNVFQIRTRDWYLAATKWCENMAVSYVIGNSWQVLRLTHAERAVLDNEPWVFTCNLFPSNWRIAGFRPSVWVFGDTHNASGRSALLKELNAIQSDEYFRQRLKHILICTESAEAEEIIARFDLPITLYCRGLPLQTDQQIGLDLTQQIFHYASTLTDMVNIAWILNPRQEIRVFGCQFMTGPGHFYEPGPESREGLFAHCVTVFREFFDVPYCNFTGKLWDGLSSLRQQGIDLVDSNLAHGKRLPNRCRLPRKPLIDGVTQSERPSESPGWAHFGCAFQIAQLIGLESYLRLLRKSSQD